MSILVTTDGVGIGKQHVIVRQGMKVRMQNTHTAEVRECTWEECLSIYLGMNQYRVSGIERETSFPNRYFIKQCGTFDFFDDRWVCDTWHMEHEGCTLLVNNKSVLTCMLDRPKRLIIHGEEDSELLAVINFNNNQAYVMYMVIAWVHTVSDMYAVDFIVRLENRMNWHLDVMFRTVIKDDKCLGVCAVRGDVKSFKLYNEGRLNKGLVSKLNLV